MTSRLDYLWRTFATALSFVAFGLCGAAFSLIIFPLASLWPHRASRRRAVTTGIHLFFRTLVSALRHMGVMEYSVVDYAKLQTRGPAIVVANHPTYLDVVVMLALIPRACCVVKSSHWRNPCFWGIVRAAQYVSNADPEKFVAECKQHIAAGYTLIIFPEGSRSPAHNRLHAFSRGFAYVAMAARAQIVPVLMHCNPPAFTKHMRWYHVPSRAFRITAHVLDAVDIDLHVSRDAPAPLAARGLTNALQTHITQHLFNHGFFKT